MPPSLNRPLSRYYKRLKYYKIEFVCPTCNETLLSKDYEKHCKNRHRFDPETQCVWCQGQTSWKKRTKYHHIKHLLDCWKNFLSSVSEPPPPPVPEPPPPLISWPPPSHENFVLDDTKPACQERRLFGRSKVPGLPPLAYELFSLADLDLPPVPFRSEGLNLAAGCVQKYLQLDNKDYEFLHVMVRAVSFPSFLSALEQWDEGKTRFLPFSCWCDGGHYRQSRHNHHRHMILYSPAGHFLPNVWKKIKIDRRDRPCKNFKIVRNRAIQSPMHLVNAIGYLSQRQSSCDGTFATKKKGAKSLLKTNHFWIFTSLPLNFKLSSVLQYDGGIMQLIHQEYRYTKPEILADRPISRDATGRWQIAVKDLPDMKYNRVLPVDKAFKPVTDGRVTEHHFHLNRGEKQYFERDESLTLMDDRAWGKTQAERGNLFYDAINEEFWTPPPYQQRMLNAIEPFLIRIAALEETLLKKDAVAGEMRDEFWKQTQQLQESLRTKDEATADLQRQIREQQVTIRLKDEEIATLGSELQINDRIIQIHETLEETGRNNAIMRMQLEQLKKKKVESRTTRTENFCNAICSRCSQNV